MKANTKEKRAGSDSRKKGGQQWHAKEKAEPAKEKAEPVAARATQALADAADAAAGRAEADAEDPADARQLCETISAIAGGVCFLGFSRGKDSVAAWLQLRKYFKRIIPFHCASVPHLSFVDQALDYYEAFFKTPIMRLMDGTATAAIDDLYWQPPGSEEEIDDLELWRYDKHDILKLLKKETGLTNAWCAFGISLTDSIDRRIYVAKCGGRNDARMTFYPCFSWTKARTLSEIRAAGLMLPRDYLYSARTLAGVPSYRSTKNMEFINPADFARIETLFPMLMAEFARQHFRSLRAAGTPIETAAPCMPLANTGEKTQ